MSQQLLLTDYLAKLKCPICQGNLDLIKWNADYSAFYSASSVSNSRFNFSCSQNWRHYRLFLIHWLPEITIDYEAVILNIEDLEIVIYQYYGPDQQGINSIEIFLYPKGGKPSIYRNKERLFDFSQIDKEKIIKRIQTILTFN